MLHHLKPNFKRHGGGLTCQMHRWPKRLNDFQCWLFVGLHRRYPMPSWLILHWRARLQCRHQRQRKGMVESTGTDVQSSEETGWKVGRFFESRILWEFVPNLLPKCSSAFFSGLLHSKRILTFVVLSPTIGFAWHIYIYYCLINHRVSVIFCALSMTLACRNSMTCRNSAVFPRSFRTSQDCNGAKHRHRGCKHLFLREGFRSWDKRVEVFNSILHAYMHTCIHAFMHTCIHAFMQCINAFMHSCIHSFIHSLTHSHIYTNIYMQLKSYGYQTCTRSSDLEILVSFSFHLRFPAPKSPWLSCFRGMGPCPKPLPALWRRGPKRGDIQRSHQRFGEGSNFRDLGGLISRKKDGIIHIYNIICYIIYNIIYTILYILYYMLFLYDILYYIILDYIILYYIIVYYIILYWIYHMLYYIYHMLYYIYTIIWLDNIHLEYSPYRYIIW